MAIPHNEIRQKEDRSWSFKLLDSLTSDPLNKDLSEIVETLEVLNDPRLVEPLMRLFIDKQQPKHIREAASKVLGSCSESTSAMRRAWWQSGDEVFMRHALRNASQDESDIITLVANNPKHPLYVDAIAGLEFGFEGSNFQTLKINALNHPVAAVRAQACKSILWDEPDSAAVGLLHAICDPDDDVSYAALDSLAYYANQRVLLGLNNAVSNVPAYRKEACQNTFEWVKDDFVNAIQHMRAKMPEAYPLFRAWLEPVWDILEPEIGQEASKICAPGISKAEKVSVSVSELMVLLNDADGYWVDNKRRLRNIDWLQFVSAERSKLINLLGEHKDPTIRSVAAEAFAEWQLCDHVFNLLDDSEFLVRKAAAYSLRKIPPGALIAERLWGLVFSADTHGSYAGEILESYLVHAPADGLCRLAHLAIEEKRESVRLEAINILHKRKASEELITLLPLLTSVPLVTWTAHTWLLNACIDLSIEVPNITELSAIDDLDLQFELAQILAAKK
jgi:HEAT repeat protein